jgi:hypothetical protein
MPTSTDVQIPPASQTKAEQMGCEHGYALINIAGLKPPSTPPSVRGTEVHQVMAEYAAHCAAKRIKSDYAFIDKMTRRVSEEAAQILETARDSISIDWQNFFAAEVHMALDEDFRPTWSIDHDGNQVPFREDLFGPISTGNYPAYTGIADVIYLYPGGTVAKIPDIKTHPRPFEPTTFQGKEYALFLFIHMPELKEIEFVLNFIRYPNIHKPAKYLRADVPQMMEECRRVRAHQRAIHQRVTEAGCVRDAELTVHAGKQCTYCPAIQNNSCPLHDTGMNHMSNMSPADRLNFRLWLDSANRLNNQAMKDYVDGTGQTIHSKDANGKGYSYGPTPTTSTTYPLFGWTERGGFELTPLIEKLMDWVTYSMPEDGQATKKGLPPWISRLRIGSTELTSPIKAGKRADLHQWIQDTQGVRVVEDEIEMKIQRAPELDEGDGEEYRTYGRPEKE